ncbi:hypothetical protein OPV22_008877 [Ensete ventricosum]|uniref:Uncharacterized protein n=1 Tax=Ensete ventricosum TaxID=4639 RepID=A0AAV8PQ19_ENSVE|nr:hypothetical protein OPV22_008877 [Ensete ventricosum]
MFSTAAATFCDRLLRNRRSIRTKKPIAFPSTFCDRLLRNRWSIRTKKPIAFLITGARRWRRAERLAAAASVVANGTAMDWVGPGLVGLSMLSPCGKWVQFGVAQSQLIEMTLLRRSCPF